MISTLRVVVAVALASLLAGSAATQVVPTTLPVEIPSTRPVFRVKQSAEFLALAARARTMKNVHARGQGAVETIMPDKLPEDLQKVDFQIWITPPAAKVDIKLNAGEIGISDGKHFYKLKLRPEGKPIGRRRRISADNYYRTLDMASVYCDAATGYSNLAAKVRFNSVPAPARFAKEYGTLKWFALEPVTKPVHHLLSAAKAAYMAIEPSDGLARVMVCELAMKTKEGEEIVTVVVRFKDVVHGKVRRDDLKLPPIATDALWFDADTGTPIDAPKRLIRKERTR